MNNEQAMEWHTMSDDDLREMLEIIKKKNKRAIKEHDNDDDLPF